MQTPEEECLSTIEENPSSNFSWKRFLLEIFQTVIMAVVLYLLIDSIVARVRVENISMLPTLQPGEFLLVNKVTYRLQDIQRGDIIIFHYPADPHEDYIKRAIGLPGDQVEVNHGNVYINGNLIEEPYIREAPLYSGSWTVPDNSVFVLGDNRNESSDSHNWGVVPRENVIGKAIVIYWPLEQMKVITHPILI